jgi:hypothetical protein
MMRVMERRAAAVIGVFFVFTLAACGGTAHTARAGRTVTVPPYGGYPATTIIGSYSAGACRRDAGTVSGDARLYISHSIGAAPAPADLYYIELQQGYLHFQADACDSAGLGAALKRGLHPGQRRWLLRNLPQGLSHALRIALR